MTRRLSTDYLIIGAGAMGMAFADTLISSSDATVLMVDRRHQPGGHWLQAYPFVRLHQPSMGYGVESRALGSGAIDTEGWNKGLLELATRDEICAYFDQAMQRTLLPTGRLAYHPMCEYLGEQCFRSIVSGDVVKVEVRRKTVDTTLQNVTVPSMRPPAYAVDEGVRCVPLNALASLTKAPERYVIVGAGKTGIDACLWLLGQGVDPAAIRWIMPRDSWLVDRAITQPGAQFAETIYAAFVSQAQAVLEAGSLDDMFDRIERGGHLLRIDPRVKPTMYRCATVSMLELQQLRRIRDVIRLGRVQRIARERIILDGGSMPTTPATLHIDCTADGLQRRDTMPVFDGENIRVQSVRTCQQVFSAALIAHIETLPLEDADKNALCRPIPHPSSDHDFVRTLAASSRNEQRWLENDAVRQWLATSRLNWFGHLGPQLPTDAAALPEALAQRRVFSDLICSKLDALAADPGTDMKAPS